MIVKKEESNICILKSLGETDEDPFGVLRTGRDGNLGSHPVGLFGSPFSSTLRHVGPVGNFGGMPWQLVWPLLQGQGETRAEEART